MGETDAIAALDLGTGTAKVAVFELGSSMPSATAEAAYAIPVDPSRPNESQVPVELWRAAVVAAFRGLDARVRRRIAAVGVTGLFPALVPLDSDGQALRPAILYNDRRATREVERLKESGLAAEMERTGGSPVTPGTTSVTGLLWLLEHEPDTVRCMRWFGHLTTWLGAWWTGAVAMERSNAALTGLYDGASGEWATGLAAELSVSPDCLPKLLDGAQRVGLLREAVAGELGLPRDIPVVLAGGDTACAAVGAGCVEPGDLFLSSGTTDTLCLCLDRYRQAAHVHCAPAPVPGRWLAMAPTMYTGGALSWMAGVLGAQAGSSVEGVLSLAAGAHPGAEGVVFLPYLKGERAPVTDPFARGVLAGMTPASTSADLARAVVEGGAFAIRHCIEALVAAHGSAPKLLTIAGRPAASALLNAVRASVTGLPVRALAFESTTLIGAAACAAVATGAVRQAEEFVEPFLGQSTTVRPDGSVADVYEALYAVYRDLYPALAREDLFRRLGEAVQPVAGPHPPAPLPGERGAGAKLRRGEG